MIKDQENRVSAIKTKLSASQRKVLVLQKAMAAAHSLENKKEA